MYVREYISIATEAYVSSGVTLVAVFEPFWSHSCFLGLAIVTASIFCVVVDNISGREPYPESTGSTGEAV